MSAVRLPVERAFATGNQGATLVVMVCAGWLWAGLYASPFSDTPTEVSAAATLNVTAGVQHLVVGAHKFKLSHSSLRSATRWLDRNGVRVRTARPSKAEA
ncbi:hypothetical protein [Stenotrophomonas sp. CFBP8994]|uniref:hypothetical protein n=1 Tax=Stenotrophomonas sp. CFBP8994 TaxID=3096527 RepID=UPI002A6AF537|nr:hypothetical protein [Stenotrophomonas sp. CFBP8994]MDY0978962.1 hypothetical protein [Stenotrophomonas sp. CFBP8994]